MFRVAPQSETNLSSICVAMLSRLIVAHARTTALGSATVRIAKFGCETGDIDRSCSVVWRIRLEHWRQAHDAHKSRPRTENIVTHLDVQKFQFFASEATGTVEKFVSR